jgi:5-methylcytosine-specific restriction endonuclease McrA
MPFPKDPIKADAYRKLLSDRMKRLMAERKGKTYKEIYGDRADAESSKRIEANKETWKVLGQSPEHVERGRQAALAQNRKGKTYEEIYGEGAKEQKRIRQETHRSKIYPEREGTREKHNSDFRYADWRTAVFERDNYTCQIRSCGIRGGSLHAHHIKEWAVFPLFRYEVWNGITLCKECHKKVHSGTEQLPHEANLF